MTLCNDKVILYHAEAPRQVPMERIGIGVNFKKGGAEKRIKKIKKNKKKFISRKGAKAQRKEKILCKQIKII